MNICILQGSPRKMGNTQKLLIPFMDELSNRQAGVEFFRLCDMDIAPCTACRSCQKDWTIFGCRLKDDAQAVFDAILASDWIVLATPIYSWYCTAPMKALLDRLVYGMNKYYGETKGPSLWAGKNLSLVVSCGYRPERGADLFEEGIKRYCKHSGLRYSGMLAERDVGYAAEFMSEDKTERARAFAVSILETGA